MTSRSRLARSQIATVIAKLFQPGTARGPLKSATWCISTFGGRPLTTIDPARANLGTDLVGTPAIRAMTAMAWPSAPWPDQYYCDLTRSTVVGAHLTVAQEAVLEDSIDVVESVFAEIKLGRSLSDLHAAGAPAAARRGGGASAFASMIPFFGHSLGLDCENHFITASAHEVIIPNVVLAIECFLGGEHGQGAGFEYVVHVGEDNVEIFTFGAPARPWLMA